MQHKTITQLRALNQQFYDAVAESFDQTRQQPWQGWSTLLDYLPTTPHLSILDLGCGNGRFLDFLLHSQLSPIYTGVDSSSKLLAKARQKHPRANWIEADLIGRLPFFTKPIKFDVVALFGVLHHIPSQAVRTELLLKALKHLNQGGLLIFSCWRFDQDMSQRQKIVPWDEMRMIDQTDLEEGDYLLNWQKNPSVFRYCHAISTQEVTVISAQLQLRLVTHYLSDGKSKKLNQYYLFTKN